VKKSYPLKRAIDHDEKEDSEFIDFIERCLEIDPERRISPE
jgi:serine/threonine protein kinase